MRAASSGAFEVALRDWGCQEGSPASVLFGQAGRGLAVLTRGSTIAKNMWVGRCLWRGQAPLWELARARQTTQSNSAAGL